jgi:hypothetical protein
LNRKLVLLNVAFLALAGALAWTLRSDWFSAHIKESAVLSQTVAPKKILAPPPPPPVKTVSPAEYVDVASRMLFAKDRNPTVVIEPPPAKPEPPMPALPRYYGQMAIGDPVALLSLAAGAQRGYKAGDAIGDFTLVSFDRDNIEFEWHGKPVKRKVEELRPKDEGPAVSQVGTVAAAPANPAAAANTTSSVGLLGGGTPARVSSLGGGTSGADGGKPADSSGDSVMGPAQPDGSHSCVPADSSPPGTVHSGFIKNVTPTVVGILCNWEKLK